MLALLPAGISYTRLTGSQCNGTRVSPLFFLFLCIDYDDDGVEEEEKKKEEE